MRQRWVVIAVLGVLCGWVGAQQVDLERLQTEAAAKRQAVGPWEQVAAVESLVRISVAGSGLRPDGPKPIVGNQNVFAFIPGGRFAVADGGHPIRVLSAETGELLCSFGEPLKDDWAWRVIVASRDGNLLMVLPDAEPAIWDTRTGACVGKLPRFDDRYLFGCFLEDGLATYRGERSRGKVPGNLQIWKVDPEKRQVVLQQSIDADDDARGMEVVGQYLLLRNYRRCQIFDAATRSVLLQQPRETSEEFLFLDPPGWGPAGRFGSLVYSQEGKGAWMKQTPELRVMDLPPGGEPRGVRRWKCPIEENRGNDHRYQARYAISPDRKVLAISQEGRVNFFGFEDGAKLCTIKANNPYDHPSVIFADNEHVFLGQQRWGEKISLIEIPSGKEVAALPDKDYYPVVSPDGRHVLTRREMMPVDATGKAWTMLPRPLVVLWKRVGE